MRNRTHVERSAAGGRREQEAPASGAPQGPRRSVRFRAVALVFALLLAAGVAAAVVIYRRHVAFRPVAHLHVPAGTTLVARIDLTHVMFYEPYRRWLLPLVDGVPPSALPEGRRERLEARGVALGPAVRELLVALGPGAGDWVIVVGGKLANSRPGAALGALLAAEGRARARGDGWLLDGGRWLGDAPDDALVLASSEARGKQALAAPKARDELLTGSGGFVADATWLGPELERGQGTLRAGSVVQLELVGSIRGGASARDAELAFPRFFERWTALDPALAESFRNVRSEVRGREVLVEVRFSREAVEHFAKAVAERVGGPRSPEPPGGR